MTVAHISLLVSYVRTDTKHRKGQKHEETFKDVSKGIPKELQTRHEGPLQEHEPAPHARGHQGLMQCTSPIEGWRAIDGGITTTKSKAYGDMQLTVRCGRCIGCRLERARIWAIRSVHEASLYDSNIFATLTYRDEEIPPGMNLHRPHLQNFFKRLRKKVPNCRFFYCGEYGDETKRPHYHALIFNWRPNDSELISRRGEKEYFTSQKLDDLWGHGHCNFSDITFSSAAYVAGYVTKKVTGDPAKKHYEHIDPETGEVTQRQPEFQGQSLRPGIGYNWIRKNLQDVYSKDQIIVDGYPSKPFRYYDTICEKLDPDLWRKVRAKRAKEQNALNHQDTRYGTGRQMYAKNKITLQRQQKREPNK